MQLNVQVRIKPFMVQISGGVLLLKWDYKQWAGFSQMIKVSCNNVYTANSNQMSTKRYSLLKTRISNYISKIAETK